MKLILLRYNCPVPSQSSSKYDGYAKAIQYRFWMLFTNGENADKELARL